MATKRSVLMLLLITPMLLIPLHQSPRAYASPSDVRTISRFDTSEPVIALTFDAGADRGYAPSILDTLRDEGVRASFGMTGVWAQQNPDLMQRIVTEGHHLINHTWDHSSFTGRSASRSVISSAQRADQLRWTEDLVRSQVGIELQPYFRPPYGDYDDSVLGDLAANGYTLNIMWTVDTLGWNGLSATQIRQRVLNAAAPGVIVLMHVGAQAQDGPALSGMIADLRARGYRFATVEQFITGDIGPEDRYFPETNHSVGGSFLRYWERFGGLETFGYPLTEELNEDGLTVQYFERARFEHHPGLWPDRFDVLLGRLGVDLADGRQNEAPFRPVVAQNDETCTFYKETGHRLCAGFRNHWHDNGALEIFGYPISEEFVEDGKVVQYFERQRFEWHPDNRPPWDILGGHLGRYALDAR